MHVSQNYMRLVFAKLNVNSHRAFVNVMASASTSLSKGSFTNDGGDCKGRRNNIGKDKGKVCQYVKRLQWGEHINNKCNNDNTNNIQSSNKNYTFPYQHHHHRKSQSIEDLVKRDTHERIKYKYKS